jgi:hypothetical protein
MIKWAVIGVPVGAVSPAAVAAAKPQITERARTHSSHSADNGMTVPLLFLG